MDRWEGKSRSRSRSRSRERRTYRRDRSGSPRDRRRPSRSPEDRRREERQRRRSRSRSRGRGYGRDLSPPSRGYERRRSSSRSPPARREGRERDGYGGRRGPASRSPPARRDAYGYGGRGGGSPPPRRDHQRGPPPSMLSDEPPAVGSIHRARVVSVRPFGAFVELPGYRKQALIHHTQVSEDVHFGREDEDEVKVKALEFFLPRGEQVWVKVLEVRQEGPGPQGIKLAASMRAVSQEDGTDLDPDNALAAAGRGGGPGGGGGHGGGGRDSDEPPELHSIHRAVVQQVRPFGVFVKLDGYRKYGLVHFSQISDHLSFSRDDSDDIKVKEIGEILSVGDPVFVKVVDITADERGPKIGCSIKYVSQSDGTDLDPANSKYRPRGEATGGFQGQQPIGASAGALAHDGAIDWGHLKADVVQYGSGAQQYDILAGDSDDERRPPAGPPGRGGGGGMAAPAVAATGANMAPLPPRGRGGGAVLPAWMTGGGAAGGGAPGAPPPGSADAARMQVTSTEQALAILEAAARAKREKRKKHKKEKKGKKEKRRKEKRSKHKKEKRSRHDSGSGSDSSSGSDSE